MGYNKKGYYIRISENSLLQLCLNGLEAYEIFHNGGYRKQDRLETYGQLYGHSRIMPDGQILLNVELVSVDTSAKLNRSSCLPNYEAMKLKRDILDAYWPHFVLLGDFHTHTYKDVEEVKACQGWQHSAADFSSIEDDGLQSILKTVGYQLSVVLAIAKMSRKGSLQPCRLFNNTLRFDIGNFRCWLTAYITYTDNTDNQERLIYLDDKQAQDLIILDSPTVLGINGEFNTFRRARNKSNDNI